MRRLGRTLRPIIAVLAILGLALTVSPPVGAVQPDAPAVTQPDSGQAPRVTSEQGEVRLQHSTHGCVDELADDHDWVASESGGPSSGRNGVRAWINASAYFEDCGPIGIDLDGNASAWVSLDPAGGNPNAIIQIGVVDCHSPTPLDCASGISDDWSYPWYFWAAGGCGSAIPLARRIDSTQWGVSQGSAQLNNGYKIVRTASHFHLYIDFAPAEGIFEYILSVSRSDPGVSCWANGNLRASVDYERFDNADSAGTSTYPTEFTDLKYSTNGGSSWALFPGSGLCAFNDTGAPHPDFVHPASCTKGFPTGTNYMRVYD